MGLLTFRVADGVRAWPRKGVTDGLLLLGLAAAWLVPEGDLLIVALFPLLILQICEDCSWFARGLGTVVPYRLGEWSYAIYLLHWPALDALRLIAPGLAHVGVAHADAVALAVIFVGVIALSAMAHAYVEKPARAMLRRRIRRVDIGPGVAA